MWRSQPASRDFTKVLEYMVYGIMGRPASPVSIGIYWDCFGSVSIGPIYGIFWSGLIQPSRGTASRSLQEASFYSLQHTRRRPRLLNAQPDASLCSANIPRTLTHPPATDACASNPVAGRGDEPPRTRRRGEILGGDSRRAPPFTSN